VATKGERRGDGFPGDAEDLIGNLERQGPVGHQEEVLHAQVFFQTGFQLLRKGGRCS